MASGVPCAVTDVGNSAYIVENSGLVTPSREPQALANAIVRLIEWGAQAASSWELKHGNEFSLPAIIQRYKELYRAHWS
jgi:glycosyltransferase involved in cell wall biosynthesis